MTKEEILALGGRELDAAVAERIMGGRGTFITHRHNYKILLPSGRVKDPAPAPTEMPPDPVWSIADVPRYSTSLDACREAESELCGEGVTTMNNRYVVALRSLLFNPPESDLSFYGESKLLMATAEQRCRAMLIAKLEESSQ